MTKNPSKPGLAPDVLDTRVEVVDGFTTALGHVNLYSIALSVANRRVSLNHEILATPSLFGMEFR